MPVDTSIWQQALRPAPTAADDLATLNQQDLQQTQLAQNKLALASNQQNFGEAQAVIGEKNALRQALGGGQIDLTTPQGRNQLYAVAPTLAPGIMKTFQDQITSQALAAKDQGSAAESNQKVKDQAFAHFQNVLGTVQNPDQAAAFITANYSDPIVGPMLSQKGSLQDSLANLQQVTQQPGGFDTWKAQAAIGIQKMAELAKVQNVNTGSSTTTQIVQPATGQVQTVGSIPNTVSPDTSATVAGENNRAALARKTQLQVAGMDENGNYVVPSLGAGAAPGAAAPAGPGGAPAAPAVAGAPGATAPAPAAAPAAAAPKSALQGLVDAVGTYQIPEGTAFSRMSAPAKAAVLSAVAQQYPGYDPTVYTERNAASRAFSPAGKSGQAVKSFNVGLTHLDTLSQLGDDLGNGSIPVLNSVGNYVAQQTGGTAQTNFNAAKNIVTDEVVKAIVGGGGGVGDRDKAAATINAAQTPEQLQQAISTVKTLMGGQLVGLQQSYTAGTGRNDFAKYLSPAAQKALQALQQTSPGGAGAPAAPAGFTITHINGQPQ